MNTNEEKNTMNWARTICHQQEIMLKFKPHFHLRIATFSIFFFAIDLNVSIFILLHILISSYFCFKNIASEKLWRKSKNENTRNHIVVCFWEFVLVDLLVWSHQDDFFMLDRSLQLQASQIDY